MRQEETPRLVSFDKIVSPFQSPAPIRIRTLCRPIHRLRADDAAAVNGTQHGTTVKFLTIIDEGSHYCIDIASRQLGAREVIQALMAAIALHGAPRHLRCDNGGEFIARLLQDWLKLAGIQTRFIEPGSPWQNGVNESFNGRFRDECLNRELLASVLEAQVIARNFRDEYNTIRPHSTLDYKLPAEYRAELLRQAPGSGQIQGSDRQGPYTSMDSAIAVDKHASSD